MPLSHIAHYLIAASDMRQTRDWYCNVLGMEEGWHPDFGFPVIWLYANGVDVVHISQNASQATGSQKAYLGRIAQDTGSGTGAIDHIAFLASGLDESLARLRQHGVEFSERQANGQALYQVFMLDPNGIKVELNFGAAEAHGRERQPAR
ncbi:MAG: VOC family protein [Betaproteobacteria bacterium]